MSISVRKNGPFFVSNVHIRVIIERPLFGRGPKRGKYEYRISKYETNTKLKCSKPDGTDGLEQAVRRWD